MKRFYQPFKGTSQQLKILIPTIFLSLFGLLMMYSAGSYRGLQDYNDAFYYVKKQALAFGVGLVFMLILRKVKVEKLKKLAIPSLIISLFVLGIIFIPGVGVESYGAKRWIDLGITTVQPSEIAKFGYVLFCSWILSKHGTKSLKGVFAILGSGLAICLLIMLEPNMSITLCVGAIMIMFLIYGGIKGKNLVLFSLPILVAIPILIFAEPYRMQRIMAFIDPWQSPKGEGYQLVQSYYALGSGGFFGVGLFNSRQKYMFLPFAESDFIFSIIGEELGFVGCVAIISIFAYLFYQGYKVALRAEDRYSSALAFGITSVMAVQTLFNVAVVTGSVPPTGLPLPFISYGGSSLVCFMSAVGILTSIAGQNCREKTLLLKEIQGGNESGLHRNKRGKSSKRRNSLRDV